MDSFQEFVELDGAIGRRQPATGTFFEASKEASVEIQQNHEPAN